METLKEQAPRPLIGAGAPAARQGRDLPGRYGSARALAVLE
jgi:hypothetical protein